jgi:hypothetical protein
MIRLVVCILQQKHAPLLSITLIAMTLVKITLQANSQVAAIAADLSANSLVA